MALELVRCIVPGKTLILMRSDRDLLPAPAAQGPQKEVELGAASNSEGAPERLPTLDSFPSPSKPKGESGNVMELVPQTSMFPPLPTRGYRGHPSHEIANTVYQT